MTLSARSIRSVFSLITISIKNSRFFLIRICFRSNNITFYSILFTWTSDVQVKKHRGLGMDGMTPVEKLQEKASVNLTLQCYKS